MNKEIKFDIIIITFSMISMIGSVISLEPYKWQHDPLAILSSIAFIISVAKFLFDIARKDNDYDNTKQ